MPAVKAVLLFVPLRIIALVRLFGSQYATQKLAEIGGCPLLVIDGAVMEFQRQSADGVTRRFVYIAVFLHLSQHDITPFGGAFRMADGVVQRRVLAHAY